MSGYRIAPLAASCDTGTFHCGREPLDEYLRRYASQDVRRNVARVFVASPEGEASRVAGYYSLSAGSVACSQLPAALAKKLPRYPVPVALIGRLAVGEAFMGRGLGSTLLVDACRKVAQASEILAMAGLVVDAKDDAAAAFYLHFGFVPLAGRAGRLLLPAGAFPD